MSEWDSISLSLSMCVCMSVCVCVCEGAFLPNLEVLMANREKKGKIMKRRQRCITQRNPSIDQSILLPVTKKQKKRYSSSTSPSIIMCSLCYLHHGPLVMYFWSIYILWEYIFFRLWSLKPIKMILPSQLHNSYTSNYNNDFFFCFFLIRFEETLILINWFSWFICFQFFSHNFFFVLVENGNSFKDKIKSYTHKGLRNMLLIGPRNIKTMRIIKN